MSQFKDKRDNAINNLIPKFIQQLTGFKTNQENFRRCVDYATGKVRGQNEMAVNTYEIKRRMNGLCEKFDIDNYSRYSELLKHWQDSFLNHKVWTDHEQVDIQWMVLEFLLEVSYNPVGALTKKVIANKGNLIEFPNVEEDEEIEDENNPNFWASLLNPYIEKETYSDDELSEWSDVTEDSDSVSKKEEFKEVEIFYDKPKQINLPGIEPPKKDPHYKEFNQRHSEEWLSTNTQNSWWLNNNSKETQQSEFEESNFCQNWNEFLKSISFGMLSEREFTTTSEYILLREIISMFLNPPSNCKFFKIEKNQIILNENTSITSSNLRIFHKVVTETTVPLSQYLQIKQFYDKVRKPKDSKEVPLTYEIYANSIEELFKPFEKHLLGIEKNLLENNDYTNIIHLLEELHKEFKLLDTLYSIHNKVILNQEKHNHVLSSHLMATLFKEIDNPVNELSNNLIVSLLIPVVGVYLKIIDSWWDVGKIYDYREEFLLSSDENCSLRDYSKVQDFDGNSLMKLFIIHCVDSEKVLAYLRHMDRRVNLEKNHIVNSSLDSFMEIFLKTFNKKKTISEETQTGDLLVSLDGSHYCELMELFLEDSVQSERDELHIERTSIITSKQIFDLFEESVASFILPFQEVIVESLKRVLEPRITIANQLIADIYIHEFDILTHFQNIRKVAFFEESHKMFEFYVDVFIDIKRDFESLTPYALTTKLESIFSTSCPQLESLFRIEFERNYYKWEMDTILDVLSHLTFEYNFDLEFFSIEYIRIYNLIFQFLIKIKYALWSLESLKFSENFSKSSLYHRPNMLDFSIRRMAILKLWLLNTIQTIHTYLMTDVIQCETINFESKLKNCSSLGAIQKLHDTFLKSIEKQCFLDEGNSNLLKVILELLNFILVFRDEWIVLNLAHDKDRFMELPNTKEILLNFKLENLETTFNKIHSSIADHLKQTVEKNESNHLNGLAGAFHHRPPIHYYQSSIN